MRSFHPLGYGHCAQLRRLRYHSPLQESAGQAWRQGGLLTLEALADWSQVTEVC